MFGYTRNVSVLNELFWNHVIISKPCREREMFGLHEDIVLCVTLSTGSFSFW